MQRLIKTLYGERGELYAITNGRRTLLARCQPRIEIMEDIHTVNAIGRRSCDVKKRHITLALCNGMDFTRDVGMEFLNTVSGFELLTDIQRTDGVFERIPFNNLFPLEIDLDGEWSFEIEDSALTKKLMML